MKGGVWVAGIFGPILTTGVALSAAAVVVANPVTAPHSDVRIPAVELSAGSGDAVDMLDEDFIRAVGPDQAVSTNPLAVLKDLVSALVADAATLGKNAVLHAFVTGATVVSRPELTAAWHPYVPDPQPGPGAVVWPIVPGPVANELRPVVEQALTAIIADAGTADGAGVLAAAFVAGASLAVEQSPVVDPLRGLIGTGLTVTGLQPLLESAASAVSAITQRTLGSTLRTEIDGYLPSAPAPAPGDGAGLPSDGAVTSPAPRAPAAAEDDIAALAARQGRPIESDPGQVPPLPVAVGSVDVPPPAKFSFAKPPSGAGPFGGAGLAALRGLAPSGAGDTAGGFSGRVGKVRADRPRN